MDILGIGFPELILIFIIAMMVFGPRRLPEIAVKLGKFVADLRNMSSGLMTEWQREIAVATRLEELEKTRQEFEEIKDEVQQARTNLAAAASSSKKVLEEARQEVAQEVKSIPVSASDDGSAKPPSQPKENGSTSTPASPEPAAPTETTSEVKPDNNFEPAKTSTQSAPPTISPVEAVNE